MIVKRETHRNLSQFPEKRNSEGNRICVNCDKLLTGQQRKYCSWQCSHEVLVQNSHSALRREVMSERNYTCADCKNVGTINSGLILDHIKPIALGGAEFDKENVQILCFKCDKKKTAKDLKLIAVHRKIPKEQTILTGGC